MAKKKQNLPGPFDRDTLLGDWLRVCIKGILRPMLLMLLGVIIFDKCYDPPHKEKKAYGWNNWDPSIHPSQIEGLNYETGEVTYRREGLGYNPPIDKPNSLDEVIKEHILENIDVEELWDRMSDEGYLVE